MIYHQTFYGLHGQTVMDFNNKFFYFIYKATIWEIREKGSQTFWIFFFPLSVGLERNMQTVKKWAKSSERVSERGKLTTLFWPCVYGVTEKKRNRVEEQVSVTVTLKFSLGSDAAYFTNTIIPIPKSRMWTVQGEIHWNRNIQSRVLTPPINKSNIFIQRADYKP